MIAFVVAMDENGVIGKDNRLPWHLPRDLQHFKRVTMGKPIVMGRKTFESIGRPLPGRENIVLTRNRNWHADGCKIFHSKAELMAYLQGKGDKEICVIGGTEIFRMFLDEVDKLYVTRIHHSFKGDAYFPELDWSQFKIVSQEKVEKDEQNPYDHEYIVYIRNVAS
ncbi:MAG: dihydrofolate reductase [Caldibacillus sp.]